MSFRRLAAFALLFLVAFVPTASADYIGAGALEFSLTGSFERGTVSAQSPFPEISTSSVTFSGGALSSVSKWVAVGATANFAYLSVSGDESSGSASATAFGGTGDVVFNLPTERSTMPYLRVSGGMTTWSGDNISDAPLTYIVPAVAVGSRTPIGKTAAVNMFIEYSHERNTGGVEDVSANIWRVGLGLSAFPRGFRPRG